VQNLDDLLLPPHGRRADPGGTDMWHGDVDIGMKDRFLE